MNKEKLKEREKLEILLTRAKANGVKIKKIEVSKYAGFNDQYIHGHYRDCLYHSAICLIAEKKGINLEAILNLN